MASTPGGSRSRSGSSGRAPVGRNGARAGHSDRQGAGWRCKGHGPHRAFRGWSMPGALRSVPHVRPVIRERVPDQAFAAEPRADFRDRSSPGSRRRAEAVAEARCGSPCGQRGPGRARRGAVTLGVARTCAGRAMGWLRPGPAPSAGTSGVGARCGTGAVAGPGNAPGFAPRRSGSGHGVNERASGLHPAPGGGIATRPGRGEEGG